MTETCGQAPATICRMSLSVSRSVGEEEREEGEDEKEETGDVKGEEGGEKEEQMVEEEEEDSWTTRILVLLKSALKMWENRYVGSIQILLMLSVELSLVLAQHCWVLKALLATVRFFLTQGIAAKCPTVVKPSLLRNSTRKARNISQETSPK